MRGRARAREVRSYPLWRKGGRLRARPPRDPIRTGTTPERSCRSKGTSRSTSGRWTSSVGEWMSEDPMTIEPDTLVGEALNQMLFGGFRHLPVTEGGAVVGTVSMRDLAESIATT
ncbi:MAG TPA: CBS domain-containing protein [Actinomycetota bacterium]